jgi:hypothetical protein
MLKNIKNQNTKHNTQDFVHLKLKIYVSQFSYYSYLQRKGEY